VTADTSIPASALDFCEASGFTNSATCYAVNLFPSGPDIPAHTPELTFQLVQDGSVGTLYYYFPSDSSFAAFGTLTANFGNTGTLRISDTPEPPTGLLVRQSVFSICPTLGRVAPTWDLGLTTQVALCCGRRCAVEQPGSGNLCGPVPGYSLIKKAVLWKWTAPLRRSS
jgi:hypothetical protein